SDQSFDAHHFCIGDPGYVAIGDFERGPVDDAVRHRASEQAMMRVDPAEPLAEAVLNRGGLRALRRGNFDHGRARRRFASTALALRRIPATPGRSNGV